MKTDTLFHELFRQWPALALDLAGLDPAAADRYRFRSEELKQAAFRLDGVLAPIEDSDDPYVFIEVQFQPDETLYRRLFAEIFLYLQRAPQACDWRALVLYPSAVTERIPRGYASLLSLPEVQRVDLSALSGQDSDTPGWELLRLIVDETDAALARAARMIQCQAEDLELLNFIETILVYKLPRSSREEIQVMLGITDIDLKQTRFYQEVLAEGRLEGHQKGHQEGRQEGRQLGEALVLRRLLTHRFGPLPDWVEQRIQQAPPEQLETWAERLLDAESLPAVFEA
ncbi:Rpn family recombination-promoting nuclease/putative transposase [Methylococcus sp. Mc7]|uniref:Rpn family recombination-promoting nuclease/putative transposase n=1 Tax=Methylococcus sp. Mc7 TaxID=2860258 RepID=UPI001C527833|nr:Rpn family recombination-promoting nuclease/putative transposase [Methylococcus sp. Mc7]QXP84029.1 Rpn family recombination-promoting nuclease/putative transposase [Methylococcus sp. Mc7]